MRGKGGGHKTPVGKLHPPVRLAHIYMARKSEPLRYAQQEQGQQSALRSAAPLRSSYSYNWSKKGFTNRAQRKFALRALSFCASSPLVFRSPAVFRSGAKAGSATRRLYWACSERCGVKVLLKRWSLGIVLQPAFKKLAGL